VFLRNNRFLRRTICESLSYKNTVFYTSRFGSIRKVLHKTSMTTFFIFSNIHHVSSAKGHHQVPTVNLLWGGGGGGFFFKKKNGYYCPI
jgi:hypothetical protein